MQSYLMHYMNMKDKRAILLQSGGLDSCVCAGLLSWADFKVTSVFIDYGQSALKKEYEMAKKTSDFLGQELIKVSLNLPWLNTLPIVGGKVESNGIKCADAGVVDPESYVPLRNHVFISIAGSLAESLHYPYICAGLDGKQSLLGKPKEGYIDAHKNFAKSLEASINEGSSFKHQYHKHFKILTPLIPLKKSEIISLGFQVKAPMMWSWSCYNDDDIPCCKCSSCLGREQGFAELRARDPLFEDLGLQFPLENLTEF